MAYDCANEDVVVSRWAINGTWTPHIGDLSALSTRPWSRNSCLKYCDAPGKVNRTQSALNSTTSDNELMSR